MIPESMRHLPTYRGLPVPYVAIWEQERVGPAFDWTPTGLRTTARPDLVRYARGVAWLDGPDRREGTPNFGGTHSARQRKCMADPRCQVCGRRQRAGPDGPLLFVLPDAADQQTLYDRGGLFINPPTCGACFRGAKELCPHLIKHGDNARIFKGTPRIAGVHGTLVHRDHRTEIVYLRFDDPATEKYLKFIMGRQYLISLDDERELTQGDDERELTQGIEH